MGQKVLIFDTSVLCCWLNIPGKETAGPAIDLWNYNRIKTLVDEEIAKGSLFVLPLATLIETGNHVAQAPTNRFECATALVNHIHKALDRESPWAAFTDQSKLWEELNIRRLSAEWPKLAAGGTSLGDALIRDVAEYYAEAGYSVEILTGDKGLKAYEPINPPSIPRSRQQPRG